MINESVSSAGLLVRSFTIYKFLTLLAAPFTSMDAFQKGFIDNRGNFKQNLDQLLKANKKKGGKKGGKKGRSVQFGDLQEDDLFDAAAAAQGKGASLVETERDRLVRLVGYKYYM